jgi:phage-related tail protein
MMAKLIVTKKEIAAQLKKSTGNFTGQAEKPRRGRSTIAVGENTWGRAIDSLVP